MRLFIFASLIVTCICLDLDHNCSLENNMLYSKLGLGYPKPNDIPMLNRKIVGARYVSILEHPYIVSIRRLMVHYLVGTLIGRGLVATVAHPLIDVPITELAVVVGQNYNDRGSMLYTVILIIFHNNFNPFTLEADLALLRLQEPMEPKDSVKVIKYVDQKFHFEDESIGAFVTGWGRCQVTAKSFCLPRSSVYFRNEITDPLLRTVHMYITEDTAMCELYREHGVNIGQHMLCVGPARQKDHSCACLGVPGAPLVVKGFLLGLLSWGFGCGYHTDLPLIYTDLRVYSRWISNTLVKFDDLTPLHFSQLYQVTIMAIATEWLIASKYDVQQQSSEEQRKQSVGEVQFWEIDKALALMEGNIFDIRDYYSFQGYQQEKMMMYKKIRETVMKEFQVTIDKLVTTNDVILSKFNISFSDSDSSNSEEEIDYDYDSGEISTSSIYPETYNDSLNSAEERN